MTEKQTRRRGAVLEQALLDAAWEEIAEHGWDGFTVDGVALRAGTAKAVIYRRWRNRSELAGEMLTRATASTRGTFRPTGDLREDLVAFLDGMAAFLRGPFGQVVRGVLYDSERPPLQSLFAGHPVVEDIARIVERACESGQLASMPSPLAMNVGHAVMMSEFVHTTTTPNAHQVRELVDAVWLPLLRRSA